MDTLVLDNLIHIFSYLQTRSRLNISEVSKLFKEIISRSWTSLEINLKKKDNLDTDADHTEKYDKEVCKKKNAKLRQYFTKYCSNLVDLHLEKIDLVEENWLDCVFAIKTLKNIAIVMNNLYVPENKLISKVPSCRDLQLLRLDGPDDLSDIPLNSILSGLPNLTELYLPCASFDSALPLQHTQKLERLMINFNERRLTAEDLIAQCPSLKYILKVGSPGNFSFNRIGSTSIVSTPINAYKLTSHLERVELIAPLLTNPDVLMIVKNCLLDNFEKAKPIIEHLVKKMHFGLNASGDRVGIYRPSILYHILTYEEKVCPLETAVERGKLEQIKFLVQLGANPEHPDPNDSYFRIARDTATMKLLLELGADPNKIIKASPRTDTTHQAFMAFLLLDRDDRDDTSTSIGDAESFINALNERGVNLNVANSKGESFLELAIRRAYRRTSKALTSLKTINWTPGALRAMLREDKAVLCHVLKTSQTIQNLIPPQLAVDMMTKYKKSTVLISEFLQHHADALSKDGYNALHHLVVHRKGSPYGRNELRFDDYLRWSVERGGGDNFPGIIEKKHEDQDNDTIMSEKDETVIDKELKDLLDMVCCNINAPTRDGETALLLVCKSKIEPEMKLKRIRVLLERKADVNIADKHGWTPLHAACYVHEWDIAMKLINSGAHVNARDKYGITPLMAAIYGCMHAEHRRFHHASSELLFVRKFITLTSGQLDFSACDKIWGRSCVHLLARFNEISIWDKIVDRVDLNVQDKEGYTPLHYAVLCGSNLTIDYLLEHGANPNIQTYALKLTQVYVLSYITVAAMLHLNIITRRYSFEARDEPTVNPDESKYMSHLISFGTLFFSAPSIKEEPWQLELESFVEPPWFDLTRSKMTLQAVNFTTSLQDPVGIIRKFFARSDLNLVDSSGNTYLHLIARAATYNFEDPLFMNEFPQLNTQLTIKNDNGGTPLGLAYDNSYLIRIPENFEFLLKLTKELGLSMNQLDEDGLTPLHYLTRNMRMAKFVQAGVPREWIHLPMPAPKRSVLEYSLENNKLSEDMLFAMVRKDPQVLMQQNWLGQTFLMVVLQRILERNTNDFNYLRILLWYKDHLNIQDHSGNTALHIACKYFHLGLVESILGKINNTRYSERFFVTVFKLFEAGCDPSIKNKRGETPQDYVPHLHEYYQSLYLNWIKQLDYKDETPPPHPHKRKQYGPFD